MKNNKIPVRTVPKSNRKTTKYHTVRPVPTSMKNNKIPHCRESSNTIGFWNCPDWYFVVFHGYWNCSDSAVFCYFSIRTVLNVVFCCFSWMLELF
jgi:hypothetical protein